MYASSQNMFLYVFFYDPYQLFKKIR